MYMQCFETETSHFVSVIQPRSYSAPVNMESDHRRSIWFASSLGCQSNCRSEILGSQVQQGSKTVSDMNIWYDMYTISFILFEFVLIVAYMFALSP